MKIVLALLGLSSVVLGAPPAEKRIAALIVPMDQSAEQLTLRIEGYANAAIVEFSGFKLKTSDDLFGVAPDEESFASFKRAETGFAESREAFEGRAWEDAERKLRATIKEYGKAVAAMKRCGNLCEAIAMYATILHARGETEEAKLVLLDLFSLAPELELDRKRYPQSLLALKAQVGTSRNAQLRGNLHVKSRPEGARVFLNGELQGFTPLTLQTVPIGKHLVRVEKPGFRQAGQLVDATAEDVDVTAELVATSSYKTYDELMDKLASEAVKDKGGPAMASAASTLKLDRAIVGMLREVEGQTELTIGYFDLKAGRRFALKRATFQGDEFGELKGEVARMVTALLNYETTEKTSKTGDPLDSHHGTEDWSSDDKGGRNKERDLKHKGGDPLDRRNGTEDW